MDLPNCWAVAARYDVCTTDIYMGLKPKISGAEQTHKECAPPPPLHCLILCLMLSLYGPVDDGAVGELGVSANAV